MSTTITQDEAAIRSLIDTRNGALRNRDVDALIADTADDFVSFSLAPPLAVHGVDRDGLAAWLGSWSKLDYEVTELTIKISGDLAFVHSIDRLYGVKPEQMPDGGGLWFRVTLGFERRAGQWIVVHEHESVPMAMDGTDRALVDLTP